jgi:hypothetical protein
MNPIRVMPADVVDDLTPLFQEIPDTEKMMDSLLIYIGVDYALLERSPCGFVNMGE